jgi:hypothetical protein
VARAIAGRRQRIARSETIVKITRPIVGILLALVIVQLCSAAILIIASFTVDEDSLVPFVFLQFFAFWVAMISNGTATSLTNQTAADAKQLRKKYGGWRRALGSLNYWKEVASINSPYLPRWMGWLDIILNGSIILLVLVGGYLLLTGRFRPTTVSNMRFYALLIVMWGVRSLPILVSKWRELSQPVTTTSPEVRPS